ncbi:MAG TPA: PEP/pyruvate-binding domain-containing protein [Bradyrhizobium sp.]|uniref:PEP/pyruvate-binding domain-containing protein n=1 Tax=Bradyrhizobium sp. TaxID=376 RepID=UPI002D7EE278|nr:PEP/pyruvate-binding domain-containing protein [Bradyrhizobium sp.]HET7885887.1 PEP/pyruvate-binding domain-containing protein [Bradyrhizobium sp.]
MEIVCIGSSSGRTYSAEEIGAKAANLARMAALGLPVPPAFVLPIAHCAAMLSRQDADRDLRDGLKVGIAFLEQATGKRFGDDRRPLLLSVRSGAARSMPGMLDTVLDVGCTLGAVQGLIRTTGRPRLAWDCRRRFLQSYAETVLGFDPSVFAHRLAELVLSEGVGGDYELDSEALERLAANEQALIAERYDSDWLEDAAGQLEGAVGAVYRSWMSERAQSYRRLQGLDHLQGTAVTVQAMVFGNGGLSSGSGVAFSRDPSTGLRQPVIDFVLDAQGEDVVSGRRTPGTEDAMDSTLPQQATELRDILDKLEREFGDVQDVEFTIEDNKLWTLQTRPAKRTPRAALRIAVDLVHEGLISPCQALERLDGIDPTTVVEISLVSAGTPVVTGIAASGGIASGRAVFSTESARRLSSSGDPVILVRPDTSTADVEGFALAAGVVTSVGARTSHAALVARQLGKPCIVGCSKLSIDGAIGRAQFDGTTVLEGDWLTVDGDSGKIYLGRLETVAKRPEAELAEVASWRSQERQCVAV